MLRVKNFLQVSDDLSNFLGLNFGAGAVPEKNWDCVSSALKSFSASLYYLKTFSFCDLRWRGLDSFHVLVSGIAKSCILLVWVLLTTLSQRGKLGSNLVRPFGKRAQLSLLHEISEVTELDTFF